MSAVGTGSRVKTPYSFDAKKAVKEMHLEFGDDSFPNNIKAAVEHCEGENFQGMRGRYLFTNEPIREESVAFLRQFGVEVDTLGATDE